MRIIDGIRFKKDKDYAICHIVEFSDELKRLIREQLSFICYGASNAASTRKIYNYNNTLKEFIKRYDEKWDNTQKGMIGELIIHVLINEFFPEYETVSPFFNIEERSIKKGFDVVLTNKTNNMMWITEIKSGELHKDKDANETNIDLLNTAKLDLYGRLNGENQSLWLNAINGAKIALDSKKDFKDAVIDILEEYGDCSTDNKIDSRNMNVFLSSVVFSDLRNSITESRVKNKYESIIKEKKFSGTVVLSVQKETYNKIYNFLKSEVK
ncbi:DUF1837 domain-containing protein [Clostridium sp. ZBS20]|uniref:DUF1837 domain-containing protein n=1 Tax=Clostridium sp. ZBS20 TaxID=2949966 RepID=UPI00207A5876|nr:DUF1837 domain-containing protein [Clostridium sp. ZBS20]